MEEHVGKLSHGRLSADCRAHGNCVGSVHPLHSNWDMAAKKLAALVVCLVSKLPP